MTRTLFLLVWLCCLLGAEDSLSLTIRGRSQKLIRVGGKPGKAMATVIFLPGDGGWRGAAISMSESISSLGYEVYGFDTKAYLEEFSRDGLRLTQSQMGEDLRYISRQIRRPVILVGWSQGAAMSIAAIAGTTVRDDIRGVITLGLPEAAVLGWDWKASLAIIARREPDQPKFLVEPLLSTKSSMPLWMIHGTDDEYTTTAVSQRLFQSAGEPKRFYEIPAANHRFDAHREELNQALKMGLLWVNSQ